MRSIFSVSLIATFLFGVGYFYLQAQAICAVPLDYRIGALDDRFGLSFDEARLAIADSEAAWEDATGRNLFTYNDTAEFSINFIFDDRQALADAEVAFKDRLDATEGMTDAMRETYDALVDRYNEESTKYEAAAQAYEDRLDKYNDTVARYNNEGGAPPEAFEELEAEQAALAAIQQKLKQQVNQLNNLVDDINQVGTRSNQLIDTYNRTVNTFNNTFGEGREFTQGDYQGDRINIYTFKDMTELKLVLVHELGHALSLDHVDSTAAVMNALLGEQTGYAPTPSDLEAFETICGASTIERIQRQLVALISQLQLRLGQ